MNASTLSSTSRLLFLVVWDSTSLSPGPALPSSTLLSFTLLWRRPYESKINPNCLIQELGIVGPFDRGFGFFLRRVLDKNVALEKIYVSSMFLVNVDI